MTGIGIADWFAGQAPPVAIVALIVAQYVTGVLVLMAMIYFANSALFVGGLPGTRHSSVPFRVTDAAGHMPCGADLTMRSASR